jgi:hypothetical protein
MTAMLTCFIDSGYQEGGKCAKLVKRYEECMMTNVNAGFSKTWQYRRLLKKVRIGAL